MPTSTPAQRAATLHRARQHQARPVPLAQVHQEIHGRGRLGAFNQRLAVRVTAIFGSMWALYFLIAWMLGWIAWQGSGHLLIVHDPYPFAFVLFLSNLIQLWSLPTLMVGQNVLAAHADARAQADHETLVALLALAQHSVNILEGTARESGP